MPLYGHEIDETTLPYEARLGWVVNLDKPDFVGKSALAKAKDLPRSRLLVGLAVGEGARQYADKLIKSNVDPQSIYVTKESIRGNARASAGLKEYSGNTVQYGGATYKTLGAKDLDTLRTLAGVSKVTPAYLISAQYLIFAGNERKYTSDITTYDPSVLASAAAGSLPKLGEQIGDDEAVMPESFAEKLGVKPADLIGKSVTLHLTRTASRPSDQEIQKAFLSGGSAAVQQLVSAESKDVTLTLRAISAKSSTSFATSTALEISSKKADELSSYLTEGTSQYKQYVAATVTAARGTQPDTVKAEIEKHDMKALTAKDLSGTIFTIVNILQGIVTGFGLLALIASVFGVINTQYISVLERTSQIGLMKALGMPRRAIAALFRYEAAWIGFIGGVIGSTIAFITGSALNPWINKQLSLGEGTNLLIFVWWQILGLVVLLILVAILAGWLPARKAARLDPIEALRTE